MAQVDVNWPSEDEDFDAIVKDEASPKRQNIAINDTEVDEAVADDTPDTEPEAEVIEPEVEPEEEPEAEPEAAEEEVEEPTEVEPEEEPEPEPAAVTKAPRNKPASQFGRLAAEILLIVALVAVSLYAVKLHSDRTTLRSEVTKQNSDPQAIIQRQTDDLIKKVGALISLPDGETPTVANVTDAAQAKQQSAFFNNAINGDKVLMYVKAGQAILYRPSTNKIVLVAPLTFNNTPSTSSATTKTTATPSTKPVTTGNTSR